MTPPSLPNDMPDIVEGPRKRHPTERVTDNGDPLVQKRPKTTSSTANLKATTTRTTSATSTTTNAAGLKMAIGPTSLSRRASAEDLFEPTPARRPQPCVSSRIIEAVDGSDDGHDEDTIDMPDLIDVDSDGEDDDDDDEAEEGEDEPEDDETELGKLLVMPDKIFR